MEKFDVVIVGAGIVGLATARSFKKSLPQLNVLLLEKEKGVSRHQTGHNSGVIHSGIYYKPDSYKAKLCQRGRGLLEEYCQQQGIPFDRCGKVIVASDDREKQMLETLRQRGAENGLASLEILSAQDLKKYEPNLVGQAGLFVPQTGIVDYTAVAKKISEELTQLGVRLETEFKLEKFSSTSDGIQISDSRGRTFGASYLVACAGLQSDRVAKLCGLEPEVKIVPFRGEYYELKEKSRSLVNNLIYPVPDPRFPFLGVHFTRMVGGGVECGPNAVLAYAREGYGPYSFKMGDALETALFPGFWRFARKHWRTGLQEIQRSFSKEVFLGSLQKMIPTLKSADIVFSGSGIRAQAMKADGSLVDDFFFAEAERQVHVLNAPSPAATASFAIGEEILRIARGRFRL